VFKNLISVVFLSVIFSPLAFSFDGSSYVQNGEELCSFIKEYYGGFNEFSMFCAVKSGEGAFSSHESAFCHKLIMEKRIHTGSCLRAISNDLSDNRLDTCEKQPTETEILQCLNN
jgi:hypothetical protein